MLVMTHLVYSVTYSVYAVLVFKNLCIPELGHNISTTVTCYFDAGKPPKDRLIPDLRAKIVCAQVTMPSKIMYKTILIVKTMRNSSGS